MNSLKISPSSLARPISKTVQPQRPCPLPIRPLPIDHFRPPRGQKQIYLPSFVITLLHTPSRPPNYATFLVPLWFSKLDLKDYLYHLYSLQTLRIRSYVIQSRIQQGKPNSKLPQFRQWFRPQSRKKMTVELVTDEKVPGQGVFVWPEEPRSWGPWMREEFRRARGEEEERRRRWEGGDGAGRMWPEGMGVVGGRAGELLRRAGRGGDPV